MLAPIDEDRLPGHGLGFGKVTHRAGNILGPRATRQRGAGMDRVKLGFVLIAAGQGQAWGHAANANSRPE